MYGRLELYTFSILKGRQNAHFFKNLDKKVVKTTVLRIKWLNNKGSFNKPNKVFKQKKFQEVVKWFCKILWSLGN
jgi:hypothetical protein